MARIGTEILVNTQTASFQSTSKITALTNGGFVVTWMDRSFTLGDSSETSIKAQVFDAAGIKVGTEFLVNTQVANAQSNATITGLSNGGFVVSWNDLSGTLGDSSSYSVKAQVFDAVGAKVGGEFLVNSFTDNMQCTPAIAGLSNGGFVVTWWWYHGAGAGYSIQAQMFDAAGGKVGTEFTVNTEPGHATFSTITELVNGGFVVTWNVYDATTLDTKGQIFDAAGARVGSEFLVNTETQGNQSSCTITGLTDGGFVVTWTDDSGTLGDNSGYSIKAQVFDAAGNKRGGEFLVNTETQGNQSSCTITGLNNGGFVITWFDQGYLKAQVFDAVGVKIGTEFQIDPKFGYQPDVAGLANGNFVITWTSSSADAYDGSESAIKAQIYSPYNGPVATNGAGSGTEDAVVNGTLAATDPDGDALTFSLVANAQHGSVVVNPNGTYTYTPTANYNGPDSFTFKANDGTNDSSVATVNLTIAAVNDAPVAANSTKTGNEDTSITGTLAASDVDGNPLVYSVVTQAAHGSVTVNSNGTYSYTPVANYNGPDSFTFKADDGTTNSNVATVSLTVTAVNDAPVAANGAGSGSENTPITGSLTASDVEGTALTYSRVAQAAHGSVIVNANGTYTYTPNAGYYGADSFTFKANDGGLDSNVATVNLTVTETSDPPTDIQLSITNVSEFAANDTIVGSLITIDPDSTDTFTYTLLDDAGGRFAINGSNLVVANYVLLDFEQNASHTILVRSTDASGLVVDKQLTILVNDINPETVTGTTNGDTIVGGGLADTINGGDGNDHLVGGGGGDQLFGGIGNDQIEGGAGDDTISGEAGSDTVTVDSGSDIVSMGAGDDDLLIVDFSGFSGGIVTGGGFAGSGLDWSGLYQMGQIAAVQFTGVARFDIKGGAGADTVRTGSNNDRASLGGGNDTIDTGAGGVQLDGGTGTDGWAADFTAMTTTLNVNLQSNTITGIAASTITGMETLGYSLSAYFQTGSGNDQLTTLAGPTNTFSDYIQTNGGDDVVSVGGGSDTIEMGVGGNDLLIVDYSGFSGGVQTGGGFSGSGLDWSGTYQVNFAGADYVQFTGVARFDIRGGSGADAVITGGNNDSVSLGLGNDTADTGAGEVQLDGGGGTDSWAADFTTMTTGLIVDLQARLIFGAGVSTITGIETLGYSNSAFFKTGSGNDALTTLTGPTNTFADYIQTNGGDDTVTVGGGNDTVEMGTGGDDLLIVDYSGYSGGVQTGGGFGSSGLDWSGTYQVNFSGPDYVQFTGVERFEIRGASGADNIITGGGNDVIDGNAGNDTLTGGAGDDLFKFAQGDGADTITDFVAGAGSGDKIDLTAFVNIHTLNDVLAISTQNGADTIINFGGGNTITMQNVLKANLVAEDFLLNQAPTIASNGGGSNASVSVAENSTAVTTVVASDPNAGTALTYSIVGGADQSKFQINASTGVLSFIAAPNFEAPTDSDLNNSYLVQVRASDGSLFDDQTITVGVTNVNDAPVNAIGNVHTTISGRNLAMTGLSIADPDATAVTTTLHVDHGVLALSASNGATLTGNNSSTVTLTGTVAQINAALTAADNISYHSDRNYVGQDRLTMTTADNGGTGAGGPKTDVDVIGINVLSSSDRFDFNSDIRNDLFFTNDTTHGLAVWQLNGSQVIANPQIGIVNTAIGYQVAGSGDFNGDHQTDFLFFNSTNGGVAIWEMNGTQVVANPQIGFAPTGSRIAATGDFNGDGKTDLLFINDTTHAATVWNMNGTQIANSAQIGIINANGGWRFERTADFNGDSKSDLLFLNDTNGGVAVWQMNGTSVEANPQVGTMPTGSHFETSGDFNGDNKADLLFIDDTTHAATIWEMNGTNILAQAQIGTINTAGGWQFERTGDFNGDHQTDLLFLNETTGGVAIWQMNGSQVVANSQIGIKPAGSHFVSSGDYNGDSKTDLLFENDTTHVLTQWLMNGTQITQSVQIGAINAPADWHLVA